MNKCKIVGSFKCNGKKLFVIRINGSAHVMEMWEIERICKTLHYELDDCKIA